MSKIKQYHFTGDISVFNLGDVHRGNFNCNIKFLQEVIRYIQENENCFWVSTGDMLEVGTKDSASGAYDSMTLDQEFDTLVKELFPIKEKCLGIVASNHHERVKKSTGLDLDKRLSGELQIPYLGITGCINLTCGKLAYFCVLHHGVGGGTAGNKLNRALNLASIHAGADIYFSGHTHQYNHTPFTQRYIDKKRNKITEIYSHSITTGHCLEYDGSYAEKYGLKPAPVGFSLVRLKAGNSGRQADKRITPEFFGR